MAMSLFWNLRVILRVFNAKVPCCHCSMNTVGDGVGLSSHFPTCMVQMTDNVEQWPASGSTEMSLGTENRLMHLEHEVWKTWNDYWNKCNELKDVKFVPTSWSVIIWNWNMNMKSSAMIIGNSNYSVIKRS